MTSGITLLGPPGVRRAGADVPGPRGSKAWLLLAYLVLAGRPVPRSRLAGLLVEEADDPGAALRWNLSQLRRTLDGVAELGGDPLVLRLEPGTVVDVPVLSSGAWAEALALPGFGGALLEGVTPRGSAALELWLAAERERVAGLTAAILHEAAHSRLARGDVASAVALAGRLVAGEPLAERGHELWVRALVAAGDTAAAERRAAECRALFRRELGTDPSPSLAAALRPRPAPAPARSPAAVDAAVEGGDGAAHVGAYERSIDLLRSAVEGARALGDEPRLAAALGALGRVLVHGVRGSDEEAMTVLHEAMVAARRTGSSGVAARAALELGHVETLRGRYPRAAMWFGRAVRLGGDDPRLRAWVGVFAGIGRTDQGDYPGSASTLDAAVVDAREAADLRAEAYALTALGRLRVLRDERDEALVALDRACALAQDLGWTSFLPFPRSQRAEVLLRSGDLDAADAALEGAYALACQVGDPCWESYAVRGRGLLAAARGDDAAALDLLTEAPTVCGRQRDAHDWVQAYCLDALCGFAVPRGLPSAAGWVEDLEAFAARRGMRELVVRAALHRAALGQAGAQEHADALAAGVDNPVLRARLSPASAAPA
ncbi:BTAD domain-containing putative transcriptional regulator [Cellulomonas endometrii]|uniref:BTAD domain-containing putative transcriptional regulator n=1 Tax=Cellulomonas endometrii TaxID=3036301 RepID=UPI0024AD64FA|nr:BTAD domain-containing putative transcriptional regulator [Cellulomonas endometrii]